VRRHRWQAAVTPVRKSPAPGLRGGRRGRPRADPLGGGPRRVCATRSATGARPVRATSAAAAVRRHGRVRRRRTVAGPISRGPAAIGRPATWMRTGTASAGSRPVSPWSVRQTAVARAGRRAVGATPRDRPGLVDRRHCSTACGCGVSGGIRRSDGAPGETVGAAGRGHGRRPRSSSSAGGRRARHRLRPLPRRRHVDRDADRRARAEERRRVADGRRAPGRETACGGRQPVLAPRVAA